jgi:hypothetical protein
MNAGRNSIWKHISINDRYRVKIVKIIRNKCLLEWQQIHSINNTNGNTRYVSYITFNNTEEAKRFYENFYNINYRTVKFRIMRGSELIQYIHTGINSKFIKHIYLIKPNYIYNAIIKTVYNPHKKLSYINLKAQISKRKYVTIRSIYDRNELEELEKHIGIKLYNRIKGYPISIFGSLLIMHKLNFGFLEVGRNGKA